MNVRSSLCLLFLILGVSSAAAENYKLGSLEIEAPWARATPKGARVASAYMKIVNNGPTADRLTGGTAAFAGSMEVHEMSMDAGVMKMRELREGLEIKPNSSVDLKPGSFHIMFQNLARPLIKGERVRGTLVFEKAGTIAVEYDVQAIGSHPASHTGTQ